MDGGSYMSDNEKIYLDAVGVEEYLEEIKELERKLYITTTI